MTRAGRFALSFVPVLGILGWVSPDLAAAPPTRLVKGPYVTAFTDTTIDVRFELDAPGPATVEIAREGVAGPPRKFNDPTSNAMHAIHVTGLEPGKGYAYGVTLGTALVARGNVTTAPKPDAGTPVRFILYGDDRSDEAVHAAVVRAIGEIPSDFLLNTGDMVEDGSSGAEWQSFFQIEAPLLRQRPLLMCVGNHELYDDEAGANFARYFGYPDSSGTPRLYGSARIGSMRIFFLNAMHDWSSGEERTWLERELTRADTEPGLVWRFAVTHHGPWSSGPHGPNAKLLAAHIPELLAAHKVDLIFAGHDHIYERGDSGSIKYVISGGGGAPLYKLKDATPFTRRAEAAYHFVELTVTPTDVRVATHRADGTLLEACGFAKDKPWDCDSAARSTMPAPPASPSTSSPPVAESPPASAPSSSSRCALVACGLRGRVARGTWLGIVVAACVAALARRRQR